LLHLCIFGWIELNFHFFTVATIKAFVNQEAWRIFTAPNAFSYASKLHYASLNIMFLTACKYGIFHATASASLNKYPAVLCFAISSGREACLSELNV